MILAGCFFALPSCTSISVCLPSHQAFAAARLSSFVHSTPSCRGLTAYIFPRYILNQRLWVLLQLIDSTAGMTAVPLLLKILPMGGYYTTPETLVATHPNILPVNRFVNRREVYMEEWFTSRLC